MFGKPNRKEDSHESGFSKEQLEQLKELLNNSQEEKKEVEKNSSWFKPKLKKKEKPIKKEVERKPEITNDNCPYERWLILAENDDIAFEQKLEMLDISNQIQELITLQEGIEANQASYLGYKNQLPNIDKYLDW